MLVQHHEAIYLVQRPALTLRPAASGAELNARARVHGVATGLEAQGLARELSSTSALRVPVGYTCTRSSTRPSVIAPSAR